MRLIFGAARVRPGYRTGRRSEISNSETHRAGSVCFSGVKVQDRDLAQYDQMHSQTRFDRAAVKFAYENGTIDVLCTPKPNGGACEYYDDADLRSAEVQGGGFANFQSELLKTIGKLLYDR